MTLERRSPPFKAFSQDQLGSPDVASFRTSTATVAVYTAGSERGQVATLHAERLPTRRLATPPT
jgi:hypothetical protein